MSKTKHYRKVPLLIFLWGFSFLGLYAKMGNDQVKQDSIYSTMYLVWKDHSKHNSEFSANNPLVSEYVYVKYLPLVEKLPRYTEKNELEFKFLFGDSLLFKRKKNKVASIVFQGTPIQEDFVDEIVRITSDSSYYAHAIADLMPVYIGGHYEMVKFFNKNVRFSQDMDKKDLTGEVVLGFIVKEDGSIDKIKVLESCNDTLDWEAYRLVKSMPKWKAGIKGKPVPVFIIMQLIFRP